MSKSAGRIAQKDLQELQTWLTAHGSEFPEKIVKMLETMINAAMNSQDLLKQLRQAMGIIPKSESGATLTKQ